MIVPSKLPHFIKVGEDGVLEFYLDHTLLSTFRKCEAHFQLAYLENKRPRQKSWALDFGSLFHECMEFYYKHDYHCKVSGEAFPLDDFLAYGAKLWKDGNYANFADTSQFKAVGGFQGFIALLTRYYGYYGKIQDNLKPVALEISFGKAKEVPLLDDSRLYSFAPFRVYLSGRIDLVYDDGRRLGPLDHKTFSRIDKNPMQQHEVQEGMTGYIYAMNYIYKKHFSELAQRDTDRVWMNYVYTGQTTMDDGKRFQRMPIIKTAWQLEEYRLRQISTVARMYQVLFEGAPSSWDTSACTDWFHGTCAYHQVHRLSRKEDQLIILQKEFVEEVWNPEKEEEQNEVHS